MEKGGRRPFPSGGLAGALCPRVCEGPRGPWQARRVSSVFISALVGTFFIQGILVTGRGDTDQTGGQGRVSPSPELPHRARPSAARHWAAAPGPRVSRPGHEDKTPRRPAASRPGSLTPRSRSCWSQRDSGSGGRGSQLMWKIKAILITCYTEVTSSHEVHG